jgi:Flp pilus assembly protein TadD
MPKRRTDDVVHVVMTDHYIQRHKPARDLLAPLSEQLDPNYRGEVVLFYPPRLPATSENELHLATAQVIDGANLIAGIPRLQKAIENHRPSRPAFYFELARAFAKSNQHHKAIEYYQAALRRKQDYAAARVHYAVSLQNLNRWTDAAAVLEPAVASVPVNAEVLNALGSTYLHLNRLNEAVAVLRRAATADADLPEIYLNLGTSLFKQGNHSEASQVLKEAIRARPGFAAAHNNLAAIFDAKGDSSQAEAHFQAAVRFDPTLTEAATRLGMLLAARGELPLAIELYRRVIQIKPDLAAHYHLALALLRLGNNAEAKPQLRIVIERDPDDYAAHFNLGTVLLNEGDYRSAMTHFEKASASPVPELRTRALNALRTAAEKLHR